MRPFLSTSWAYGHFAFLKSYFLSYPWAEKPKSFFSNVNKVFQEGNSLLGLCWVTTRRPPTLENCSHNEMFLVAGSCSVIHLTKTDERITMNATMEEDKKRMTEDRCFNNVGHDKIVTESFAHFATVYMCEDIYLYICVCVCTCVYVYVCAYIFIYPLPLLGLNIFLNVCKTL